MKGAAIVVVLGSVFAPGVQARPTCEQLAARGQLDDGAAKAWAEALWVAVRDTEQRLDGHATAARVTWLAPGGEEGAWYCRGDDHIYVAGEVVDYAWRGRRVDGASFLAFVLAHEVAHRRFDDDDAEAELDASCAEPSAERRADQRAAFLVALAPGPDGRALSPFQLVRRDSLAAFFAHELGWSEACARARGEAVAASVTRMGTLARLYEVALALALSGPPLSERAPGLLAAIDGAVNGAEATATWAALPELKLARAVMHLERAAAAACPEAFARAPLTPSACTLRCRPVMPAHALLAPIDRIGVRAANAADSAGELATVRRLLDQATSLGATTEQVASLEACAAFVARDEARRTAWVDRLVTFRPRTATLALGFDEALRGMRAAAALQSFLIDGAPGAALGSPSWLAALNEWQVEHEDAADSEAGRLVAGWLARRVDSAVAPEGDFQAPRIEAWVRAAACAPGEVTVLADGWRVASGPTCAIVDQRGEDALRFIEIAPTALSESLASWSRYCKLEARGRDDAGSRVSWASCPAWDGPDAGWLLFGDGDRWRRGVRVAP